MNNDKTYETPLLTKLDINSDGINLLLDAPETLLEQLDKNDINCLRSNSDSLNFLIDNFDNNDSFDYIHLFTKSAFELKEILPKLRKMLKKDGSLWASWPKKSAKVETDLTEMSVIKSGLNIGLVDVKVVSVDEIWSALKFVYRVKDRD